jgi:anti-anti-sigma factor
VAAHYSIEIEIHAPESCIVTLHGEHDSASSEGLTLALVLARRYEHVLVDLTPCTFLDARIVGAVLEAAARMRSAGGALELIVPTRVDGVYRTLALTGVLPLLPIHATRSDGIGAIATAARLRAHARPVSLRAVVSELEHFSARPAAARERPVAKTRGITVLRAHVADTTSELGETLERAKRRAA